MSKLKLYYIEDGEDHFEDEAYDFAKIAAPDKETALARWEALRQDLERDDPSEGICTYLGEADEGIEAGVICSGFHDG